jgi:gamma-glutamyl-gamma-aminobutyrate hydrolase PuuD
MSKKVYVIGPQTGYNRWINGLVPTSRMEEADIVILTGGEDINPSIYNRKCLQGTYYNPSRDNYEIREYKKAIEIGVPLISGTCRGFQLAAALNGGLLIQDVTSHWCHGTHAMTNGSDLYEITSLHHQMVYPYTMPKDMYDILYWAAPSRSQHYLGLTDDETRNVLVEPEVMVIRPNDRTKILGIQGHPEMMTYYDHYKPTLNMLNNLVDSLLNDY